MGVGALTTPLLLLSARNRGQSPGWRMSLWVLSGAFSSFTVMFLLSSPAITSSFWPT